jgi:hypothetical protein
VASRPQQCGLRRKWVGNVPIILIGVVALIAAGTLQAIGLRRG